MSLQVVDSVNCMLKLRFNIHVQKTKLMRTHIIRRQFLEVVVQGTESEGFALQDRLMRLCQERLNPALEGVLDRWTSADEHWTIDRLDIDAGSFDREGLERGLVEAVTRAIEQNLRERAPCPGSTDVSRSRGQPRLLAVGLEASSRRWGPSGSSIRPERSSAEPKESIYSRHSSISLRPAFCPGGLICRMGRRWRT